MTADRLTMCRITDEHTQKWLIWYTYREGGIWVSYVYRAIPGTNLFEIRSLRVTFLPNVGLNNTLEDQEMEWNTGIHRKAR